MLFNPWLYVPGLFVFLGTLLLANASINASRILHSRLLTNVMRAPMMFFDTTPIGRVVNRFAKVRFILYYIPYSCFSLFLCFVLPSWFETFLFQDCSAAYLRNQFDCGAKKQFSSHIERLFQISICSYHHGEFNFEPSTCS